MFLLTNPNRINKTRINFAHFLNRPFLPVYQGCEHLHDDGICMESTISFFNRAHVSQQCGPDTPLPRKIRVSRLSMFLKNLKKI